MAELLAAAAGVSLQLATTGTAATVTGAMLPPALLAAWRLDQLSFAPRLARAARTVEVAGEELNVDVPTIERMAVRDEATTSLVGRVLAASANAATAQEKIDALGRVMALGLSDGDRVDEALMLARALDDLEAPHVRTLTAVGQVRHVRDDEVFEWHFPSFRPEPWEGDLYSLQQLRDVAGGEQVAPAVIGVLVRHGLLVQSIRRTPNPHGSLTGKPPMDETPVWSITELGTNCLRLLQVPARRPRNWARLVGPPEQP